MAQDKDESISDKELYEGTLVDEPVEEKKEPKEEVTAEPDKGSEVAEPEEEKPEEPEVEEPKDHRIPLTELLNEREKRQNEQRRAEQYQRELEQLRSQIQAKEQPQQVPDQFVNPDAYNAYWEQKMMEQQNAVAKGMRDLEANFSLRQAHKSYGDTFEQAYNTLLQRAEHGDRGPAQLVANSPDPGEALVNWYQRERTIELVGNDPETFTQRVLEEALNNPEFLAQAIEKAQGVAKAQPSQVKIPPSLNKATSAARSDDNEGTSDSALYHYAIGR